MLVCRVTFCKLVLLAVLCAVLSPALCLQPESARPEHCNGLALWRDWLAIENGAFELANATISHHLKFYEYLPDGSFGSSINSPTAVVQSLRSFRKVFPDLDFHTSVGPLIDDSFVAGRWSAVGTYAGGFPGATASAGSRVQFNGTDILHVKECKVSACWTTTENLSLLRQLGVLNASSMAMIWAKGLVWGI